MTAGAPRFRYLVLGLMTASLAAMLAASFWTVEQAARFHGVDAGLSFELRNLWDVYDFARIRRQGRLVVSAVDSGGVAERAGIQAGDTVIAVNGRRLAEAPGEFFRAGSAADAGTPLRLEVRPRRSARPGATEERVLERCFRPSRRLTSTWNGFTFAGPPRRVIWVMTLPLLILPLVFFLVGALVGWLRPRDSTAFLISVSLFALGTSLLSWNLDGLALWPAWALAVMTSLTILATVVLVPTLLVALSVFPNPTRLGSAFLSRRWALVALPVPYGVLGTLKALSLVYGWRLARLQDGAAGRFLADANWIVGSFLLLGGSLLIAQRLETRGRPHTRLAVIEAGLAVALAAGVMSLVPAEWVPPPWRPAFGFTTLFVLNACIAALPISIAYAVLTRRVFGIRFILRRGLQHLFLSKGALVVEGLAIFFVLQQLLLHGGSRLAGSLPAVSGLSVAGGLLGIAAAGRVNRRIMPAIDRRFFKEMADVRQVLLGLSDGLSRLRTRDPILERTAATVLEALHAERVVVLLRGAPTGVLRAAMAAENARRRVDGEQPGADLELADSDPIVVRLGEGEPWVVVHPEAFDPHRDADARLRALNCELLISLPRGPRLFGVMALGAKLSEEPYSREDKDLLVAVARAMAMALENAELLEVAEREGRQARELEIARQVQRNLFPQELPQAPGWDFAALCRPARQVGGDYYDLFEVGAGRVAFALGDVSGKGVGPSLLMASVHATIRSRLQPGAADLRGLVGHLNEYLLRSSAPGMFITLFVGLLDLPSGRLSYVNAGHLPPLVLAGEGGEAGRLEVGGAMVGILPGAAFEEGVTELAPGSLLAIFSDGVTEAEAPDGNMLEESGAAAVLVGARHLPAALVLARVVEAVDRFAAGREQADDISLIVIRRAG